MRNCARYATEQAGWDGAPLGECGLKVGGECAVTLRSCAAAVPPRPAPLPAGRAGQHKGE